MSNWFNTGLAGQIKFKEMEALRAITTKQNNVRRFKLKPSEKAKIVFLDHPKVWLYEHSVNVDGRWETFTCTSDKETCPLCMNNNKASAILVATVIDTRKTISNKTGKEYQYQKALFVMKGKALRAMMRQFLEGDKVDLTHYTMDVERDTDKQSVACGEFFTLGKKLSVPSLETLAKKIDIDPKEYLKPYDYMTLLAPKTDRELRVIAGMPDPMGGNESSELDELGELGIDLGEAASETNVFDDPDTEEEEDYDSNLELAGLDEEVDEEDVNTLKKDKPKKKNLAVVPSTSEELI